ncbi:response regulator [Pandoraea bronchicola]|uniref:Fis family transcriptional regulator n=1 Tax=Pandoraea bronchicola TaxID=2508287 RepID=A0A5E5BRJ6_9BURK|nr:response regulator [Pandoraea bronchicola]VVE87093.1 Fis family transcriptional regulator [Pandoraea bronchicola]
MNAPTITVVLIEDDRQIRRYVRVSLEGEAMRVLEAENGEKGLAVAASAVPDVVIVDLGLPDIDGLEVIHQLRHWSSVPIIVLTARAGEEDKVRALDAGADDYLTKPFGINELLARIRAQLRRQDRSLTLNTAQVSFGAVTVDLAARSVWRDDKPIHLTAIEYRLLAALLRHAGRLRTHRQLLQEVWGPEHIENSNYLRIYIGTLRHKLEVDPAQPEHLLTEAGVGYRLTGVK